jgi:hypothetical protein
MSKARFAPRDLEPSGTAVQTAAIEPQKDGTPMTTHSFVVESRPRKRTSSSDLQSFMGAADWRSDCLGENPPRSREECESDIQSLEALGGEWTEHEYRVTEVRS